MPPKAAFLLSFPDNRTPSEIKREVCPGAEQKRITLTQEERVREFSKTSDKQGKQYLT